MTLLLTVGSLIGLSLSLILGFTKTTSKATKILAVLGIIISYSLALNAIYTGGHVNKWPHLIGTDNANPFLIPPLIFFYTQALTNRKFQFRWRDLFHLIPFVAYALYLLAFFLLEDANYKLDFLSNLHKQGMPRDLVVSSYLKILQAGLYFLWIYKIIKKHRLSIKSEFSYIEKINLRWLMRFTLGFSLVYFVRFIGISLPFILQGINLGSIEGLMELLNALFILLLLVLGIRQPQIFRNPPENQIEDAAARPKLKYINSNLDEAKSAEILRKLLAYMEDEKPYLNNEITIGELADMLGLHSKTLSQVINEQLNVNFFNFINGYRVEEVKAKLRNPDFDHYSILGIAYDAGFSSKSSFNSIFKKFTATTPSNYKSGTS